MLKPPETLLITGYLCISPYLCLDTLHSDIPDIRLLGRSQCCSHISFNLTATLCYYGDYVLTARAPVASYDERRVVTEALYCIIVILYTHTFLIQFKILLSPISALGLQQHLDLFISV